MIMKHFTISPLAIESAGYSPKMLVVVITLAIVAAGVAVAISLGFTGYHKGNYCFVYIPTPSSRKVH